MKQKRNIILITIDALRADYCGFINNELGGNSPTKKLDKIAEEGIIFTNCFAAGVPTFLSFPALFTSKYPSLSMNKGIKLPNYPTFVEKLKGEGYNTYGIVDSNPYSSSLMGFSKGFDEFKDYTLAKNNKRNHLKRLIPENIKDSLKVYLFALSPERFQPKSNTISILEEANETLKNSQKSIFMWLHFMDVHWPYRLPERKMPLIKRAKICKSRNKYSSIPNSNEINKEDIDNMKYMYTESIKYLDKLIAPFISQAIERYNSTIFLISDHGEELGERGNFDHQENVYVEVAQIPFVIMGNNIKKRVNEMCSNLDIGKMILNYAKNKVVEPITREYVITETVYPSVNKQAKGFSEIKKLKPKKFLYSIRNSKITLVINNKGKEYYIQ